MFRLSKLSLANRSVIALLTVVLALFGFVSVGQLKQELFPSLEFPQAAIVTTYPGASPEVVDSQVSQPLESAVAKLDGIKTTSSTSQSGFSTVRVSFDYGTSSAKVSELLNNAVDSIKSSLPTTASPKVFSGGLDTIPVVIMSVTPKGDTSIASLEKQVPDLATSLFSKVSGVKDVQVGGIKDYRINLKLNQFRLAASGLNLQSIQTALKTNGFVIPAGTLEDNQGQISVEVGTPVESVDALKALPLAAGINLGNVAEITYDPAPVTSISRVNGKPAIAIAITKTQDGNTVSLSHAVQPLESQLVEKLGGEKKVAVTETFNQAPYVEQSIHDLISEGLLGLTFAVIIILLFLRSWRSTLVTAISIPTSLLIAFIGLFGFGYSLNLFTLSALTIAIGRVVDDSIVVIENINRHLSYGEEKFEAILSSVKEVAGAITAATLTTVAVFLPIAGVGGFVGQLFRPFALTFTVALIASLFVSLTIVPVIAYWFLKVKESGKKLTEAQARKLAAKIREEEHERERNSLLQRAYLPVLEKTQKRPVITLVASVLILIFTFNLVPFIKTNFIGNSGSNSFAISQTVPSGSSLEAKSIAAAAVEKLLLDSKDTEAITTTIGANDSRVAFGQAAGGIQFQVKTKSGVNGEVFQAKMEKLFKANPDLGKVAFQSGGSFGSTGTVDVTVTAKTDEQLRAGVNKVVTALDGKIKNVAPEITSTLSEKQRTLKISVNRQAAAQVGLSEIVIGQIVAGAMSPQAIGTINIDGKATSIFINSGAAPATVDQVRNIAIGPLRLYQLATIEMVSVPTKVTTSNGERAATVSLTPDAKASLTTITADVTKALEPIKNQMPAGTSLLPIGGVSADQAEAFGQLFMALLAAIAIVYLVMVATFRSLIQPLVLLISIPFAATGAFVALLITNTSLGLPALIGMLLLVGIVVTNAIVLIDLINQYRIQGVPLEQAIMDGARQRLRPILMTALATIGALSPLVLGITGSGGFISQPLGVVVIGGLFSSTVLTLIIVPVLYRLIEGRKEKRANKRMVRAKGKLVKA